MSAIGIILIVLGLLGFILGTIMFGDIGITCMLTGAISLFSGIGFKLTSDRIKQLERKDI